MNSVLENQMHGLLNNNNNVDTTGLFDNNDETLENLTRY